MAPCAASKREAATPTRFGSPCAWLEAARTITWKPIPPDRRPTQLGGENPPVPVEFGMLSQATADGTLTLTWRQEPGKGANGRGCRVAKVWLIRK